MIFSKEFPLTEQQQGAMLGNGLLGAHLWGEKNTLNMSIGCASLWDHRGGLPWTPEQNFEFIRNSVAAGDIDGIKAVFAARKADGSTVTRPTLTPCGRAVIHLPAAAELLRYETYPEEGMTRIVYQLNGKEMELFFCSDMSTEHGFSCFGLTDQMSLELIPSYSLCKTTITGQPETLADRGYEPPDILNAENLFAFSQKMPVDPAFSLLLKRNGKEFTLDFFRGIDNPEDLRKKQLPSFAELNEKSKEWWHRYFQKIPRIETADKELDETYYNGMYKYGIMTNPAGVAPGLQGPWIEDHTFPPWQGDYHFNINVQMCHSPGFKAGLFEHLMPLFRMVLSWKESLRYNAKCFVGIENGYMLPHATDDRGTCMGSFWTGSIDHACTAWIAMMMFDYCDYSGDFKFLKEEVFDFMKGVMNVFEKMLDEEPDGTLSLPVSISPEYRGTALDACGKNSSFQLAAIHNLARNLLKTAELLNEKPESFWEKIESKLPQCSIYEKNGKQEIALWDGLALEESHRHHSHLGGICPFNTIDPTAPEWKEIIFNSNRRWTGKGMGEWTGWGITWASQLRTRLGNAEAAVLMLELWKKCFTNKGGNSLHDALFWGFTEFAFCNIVMQMDAAMGAVTAIQDLFACDMNGVIYFFRGIPDFWKHCSFEKLHLPGGVIASGEFRKGKTVRLKLTAARDTTIRYKLPDGENIAEISLRKNEIFSL
ncbi:MAG: hypothetical protein IKB25_11315 [Lentisphaeria bacterium]|nr:hypothetical protein [Lentisphaeria bacterium]